MFSQVKIIKLNQTKNHTREGLNTQKVDLQEVVTDVVVTQICKKPSLPQ